jgi:hypothetical protein
MKKIFFARTASLSIFLVIALLFCSCKKNVTAVTGTGGNQPPAITGVGTPVGNPVTKNIGTGGGSLASLDGRLELTIPSGALNNNTDISIQPVSNLSPGGLGLAYQLLPEGIAFNIPVTITCHYTDGDINGSHPFFLYIASQDSIGSWHADRINRDLDTIAKTISVPSTHFSIWTMMDDLKLTAPQTQFKANETNTIEVDETIQQSGEDLGDDLAALNTTSQVPASVVSNWSINGQGVNTLLEGKIGGSGSNVNYVAPSVIDEEITVQVSVEIKYHLILYNKGKKIAEFNKFILFINLTLEPNSQNYSLTLEIGEGSLDVTNYAWSYTYTDKATMDISIVGNTVIISNIVNYPTSFFPIADYCSVTYTSEDSTGPLNVVTVQGVAETEPEQKFNLHITSANGSPPSFSVHCPNEPPQSLTGVPVESNYDSPDFKLDGTDQTFNTYDPTVGPEYIKYTLVHI